MQNEPATYWVDHLGRRWRVSTTCGRIKYRSPGRLALRAFIFQRDNFTCQHCGVKAINVPDNYDGAQALGVERGWCLLVDHIVSRRNGGSHHPDNLQTLCDSCNARKAATVDRYGVAP